MSNRPAIFLDRDGTLIKEVNFLSRVEDLEIYEFTLGSLRSLKNAGFALVVTTNQSGIGRGIYTEDDMHSIHREMDKRLEGLIDGYYFCPHLPDEGCKCRKPGTGMLDSACVDLGLTTDGSWMVGDKRIDIETAIAANIRSAMVLTGYGQEHHKLLEQMPDVLAEDLGRATAMILRVD
ncbi:MAG: HAD family hydrolase [Blastocatellia bacterium]|nr:HAD family hydrolase [Blastocatellia bacterium]